MDIAAIAAETLAAVDGGTPLAPLAGRVPGFDLAAAYRISAEHRRLRLARGARLVGQKLGFTNRTIWPEYGVDAPIRGDLFDTTCHDIPTEGTVFDLSGLQEPKIEPEIALGMARAPEPGMDEAQLMACIGWVAHGVEIVQSPFPGWRFAAPDTVAAGALHGAYLMGPRLSVAGADPAEWARRLADFQVALEKDGEPADRGHASDVLGGGPLAALGHLIELLAADPDAPPFGPGSFLTTGTVTRALDIRPGESWQTRIAGLPLPGLSLEFR